MADQPKSLREQIVEARMRANEELERRKSERNQKLCFALAEYFADKWQEDVDLFQSDAITDLVTYAEGGVPVCLDCEVQNEPECTLRHDAVMLAMEKLRERGLKVCNLARSKSELLFFKKLLIRTVVRMRE